MASSDNFTGTTTGVSLSTGLVSGSPDLTGTSTGVSVSAGRVSPAPSPPAPDAPTSGGYAWSFSGDATMILDVDGFVNGLVRSVAHVGSGITGHAGVIHGTISTENAVGGRVRIREDDDLEVLQVLGLI